MHHSDIVLAIDVDAVRKVEGDDALCALWNGQSRRLSSTNEAADTRLIAYSHHL